MKEMPLFDPTTTLFVSDLDGTLLGKDAMFPAELAIPRRINALTAGGLRLTYATARTIQTVKEILSGIRFVAPVALMNGVLIRDMEAGAYCNAEYLSATAAKSVLHTMEASGLFPFLYSLQGDTLSTAYVDGINPYMRAFMDGRIEKYRKPFTKLRRLTDGIAEGNWVVYIVMMESYETLLPVVRLIEQNPDLRCAFYRDSYEPHIWYLEIFSAKASKGAAIQHLKRMTGARHVVVFGDNRNDLPMFAESDFCCAVAQAPDEVKAAADLVIGSAEKGGVVDFLEQYLHRLEK